MNPGVAVAPRPAGAGRSAPPKRDEDLELVLDEVMAAGTLNDRQLLVRLVRASQAALRAVRAVGACGYGCPTPGLLCPALDGSLDDVLEQVLADGFELAAPASAALAAPACVCGEPMVPVAVQRGGEVRTWAGCDTCYHWVRLGEDR